MPLTDLAIRRAKPRDRAYKLGDSGGLYLQVQPSGRKFWHQKYRILGREKKLSIGMYPDVSLSEARKRRDEARVQIATGKDPSREKQLAKLRAWSTEGNSFGEVATEFLEKRDREGMSAATVEKSKYYISRLGPAISRLPVSDITTLDLLAAIRKIEAKGNYETARRVLQLTGRVFRYAVATARVAVDPTRDLRGALTAPQSQHFGAIIDPEGAGALLRAIDGYEGYALTKLALQLAPHVFVRPGEMRHAEWREVDLEAAVWSIPIEKMKMRRPHHVPLSRQSIDLLKKIAEISGPSGYVFPSIRTPQRPMSENTVNAGLRRLGFSGNEMTAHGFRAMASTLLNESGLWSSDAIERALAHGDTDRVRSAYHRGAHWKERVKMAQWWSDYLDQLEAGGAVINGRFRKIAG